MKFDKPATQNPIDRMEVVGRPHDRIDGPMKTTGTAPYAYERHNVVANQAYGVILGAAISKGRINSIDTRAALAAPGVISVVTYENAGKVGKAKQITAKLLAGPQVDHYDQAVAIV
ncbi:MAG: xanthine dehydrogenase, partial [Variovorax sp.]|nr:xanthine dehydrogenase [Variovorax sp.]